MELRKTVGIKKFDVNVDLPVKVEPIINWFRFSNPHLNGWSVGVKAKTGKNLPAAERWNKISKNKNYDIYELAIGTTRIRI